MQNKVALVIGASDAWAAPSEGALHRRDFIERSLASDSIRKIAWKHNKLVLDRASASDLDTCLANSSFLKTCHGPIDARLTTISSALPTSSANVETVNVPSLVEFGAATTEVKGC
jgi:hypothetical protein